MVGIFHGYVSHNQMVYLRGMRLPECGMECINICIMCLQELHRVPMYTRILWEISSVLLGLYQEVHVHLYMIASAT